MVVRLEGDGELDLELGLGLGLDVDLRKSSSSISAAFDPRKESGGLGWGESIAPPSPRRRPSPPPPLVMVKAESCDPEFPLAKNSGKDKNGKLEVGKDGSKKKRPTLPKKEVDEKDLKERDKKPKKDEKEKEEKEEKSEKEEKPEKEEEKEDDDKGDLEPSLKRAKRFCMDSKVQKHFQLTLWYDEEKVLFKELFCAFGRDWAQISVLMCGTKSPTQIKNFYYDVRRSLLTCLFGSGNPTLLPHLRKNLTNFYKQRNLHTLVEPFPRLIRKARRRSNAAREIRRTRSKKRTESRRKTESKRRTQRRRSSRKRKAVIERRTARTKRDP